MADRKTAKVIYSHSLSPVLQIFRIVPEEGSVFPDYKAGQYIALSRENCKLTKKVLDEWGRKSYIYDLDENGNQKRGMVTHSYSIASAPYETQKNGYLEFYIALEMMQPGQFGRLTECLFLIEPESNDHIHYVNRIVGEFTLEKRAAGFTNLLMVGTGTGIAPFVSMIKQLSHETNNGIENNFKITLFHTNRTTQELGYHKELQEIEASKKLDFIYVPTVSRPVPKDFQNASLGIGRANNILRLLFDLPMKEEEDLEKAKQEGKGTLKAEKMLMNALKPILPPSITKEKLLERFNPTNTIILNCGNPLLMEDISYVASQRGFKFEKEEW